VKRRTSLIIYGERIGAGVEEGMHDIRHHTGSLWVQSPRVGAHRDDRGASRDQEGSPEVTFAVAVRLRQPGEKTTHLATFLHNGLKDKAAVWIGGIEIGAVRDEQANDGLLPRLEVEFCPTGCRSGSLVKGIT
jgi:hypothetical protein